MSTESSIIAFKGQQWADLKEQYSKDNLFEDPLFAATSKSLFFTQSVPRGVTWKRPFEAMENPQFEVGGYCRADFDQGYVGNCWFIAGCVGIMQSEKCFAKVVPKDQGFDEDNYKGMFHFRFWLYGDWIDVVVDDRLPYWPDGRLLFCSNKQQPNELWGALLEKAYAKVYGSYEALDGGFTTDALIDMSGGIEESFDIKKMGYKEKDNFWSILYQAYHKNSIMGCSINADPAAREARMYNGLVKGHAYTITKVTEISVNGSSTKLIRCRNPWGNEVEWKGAWSDNSREWNTVARETRDELLSIEHDGEFWMPYSDFMSQWDSVQICHLTADSFSDELLETDDDTDLCWKCTSHHGQWTKGVSAGGCGQPNMAKFWINPQFFVKLSDVDKDDNENMATIIIALMQKDTRLKRIETKGDTAEEYLQFRLFKIKDHVSFDENQATGLRLYSSDLERIGTSGTYINKREVTKRFRVPPGNYIIIPSTYDEGRETKFMLRFYTEQIIEAGSLDIPKDGDLDDSDIFFDNTDAEDLFNDWSKLMGGDGIIQAQEPQSIDTSQKNVDVKEACRLM